MRAPQPPPHAVSVRATRASPAAMVLARASVSVEAMLTVRDAVLLMCVHRGAGRAGPRLFLDEGGEPRSDETVPAVSGPRLVIAAGPCRRGETCVA